MIGENITQAAQHLNGESDEKRLAQLIEAELEQDAFEFVRDVCSESKKNPRPFMLAIIQVSIERINDPERDEWKIDQNDGGEGLVKGLRTVEAIVMKAIEERWKAR